MLRDKDYEPAYLRNRQPQIKSTNSTKQYLKEKERKDFGIETIRLMKEKNFEILKNQMEREETERPSAFNSSLAEIYNSDEEL